MNEYIEMVVFAGWVEDGLCDDEYQKYLRAAPNYDEDETMTYEEWKSSKAEWERLNQRYKAEVEPYYKGRYGGQPKLEKLATELLNAMSWIEADLRY